ncbi:MAG: glycosyltransferase family 39 protein [Candidatus Korobacteraceae bacterium]
MTKEAPRIATPSNTSAASLAWMVAVAFGLRIATMLLFRTYDFGAPAENLHTGPNFIVGMETGSIAGSLALGQGFSSPFGLASPTGPTAWIGPIYPFFCAVLFKLFGMYSSASVAAILAMNSVFAALTCIPLVRLGERTFGIGAARWSGWGWALCPLFFRWPLTWVWEISLTALLATILLLITVRWAESPGNRQGVLFGFVSGVAMLANPALLIVSGVGGLWVFLASRRKSSSSIKPALLAGLICALVISPWIIRNWAAFGSPVFVRSNFWVEFALGNYHLSNGMGWRGKHPTVNVAEFEAYRKLGELGYVEVKRELAGEFVRMHPAEFFNLTLKRMRVFWSGEAYEYQPDYAWWRARGFGLFSLFAGLGLWLAVRRRVPAAGLFLFVIFLYPAAYYITFSHPRYRHAIEPVLLMAVVYLWMEGCRYFLTRARLNKT